MKVLVTGATGFLGKYVIDELSQYDYKIIAIGRNESIGETLNSSKTTFIACDFTKQEDIDLLDKDIDMVVHAGALSTVWGRWYDFLNVNVLGTQNIIKYCEDNNVKKLVYISSPSIYSGFTEKLDIKEEDVNKKNKLNYYIKSKILAEELIANIKNDTLETVVIRPRGLFGIGDTSLIPRILKLNSSRGIPLINEGNNLVDITCVENVAYAIRLCLESDNANGKTYNLTNGEPKPFKEVLELLFKEINVEPKYFKGNYMFLLDISRVLEFVYRLFRIKKEPIITKYTVATASFSQTLNIDKIKNDLNYKPLITLEEGMKKYGKHYKENK